MFKIQLCFVNVKAACNGERNFKGRMKVQGDTEGVMLAMIYLDPMCVGHFTAKERLIRWLHIGRVPPLIIQGADNLCSSDAISLRRPQFSFGLGKDNRRLDDSDH